MKQQPWPHWQHSLALSSLSGCGFSASTVGASPLTCPEGVRSSGFRCGRLLDPAFSAWWGGLHSELRLQLPPVQKQVLILFFKARICLLSSVSTYPLVYQMLQTRYLLTNSVYQKVWLCIKRFWKHNFWVLRQLVIIGPGAPAKKVKKKCSHDFPLFFVPPLHLKMAFPYLFF